MVADRTIGEVEVDGLSIPIVESALSTEITGLPHANEGVILIVSKMVYEAAAKRNDLVIPHKTVRDETGAVIGCRALARPA